MIAEKIPNKYVRRIFMIFMTGVVILDFIVMILKGYAQVTWKAMKSIGAWYKEMWNGIKEEKI